MSHPFFHASGSNGHEHAGHRRPRRERRRDQLYKYFETVPPGDFDSFTSKLVAAGSTLEFLKYSDALFEILLVGGLLQPGGSFVEDGTPPSPFSIVGILLDTTPDHTHLQSRKDRG